MTSCARSRRSSFTRSGGTGVAFAADATLAHLDSTAIRCPAIDAELFGWYLTYFVDKGIAIGERDGYTSWHRSVTELPPITVPARHITNTLEW